MAMTKDMNMEMDMPMGHTMNMDQKIQNSTQSTMAPMTMSTIFTSGTEITLFFSAWTTSSTLTYIFTLLFLFFLTLFNRFLGALKFQFEASWSNTQSHSPVPTLQPAPRRIRRLAKERSSPLPTYMEIHDGDTEEETPLSRANIDRCSDSESELLSKDSPRRKLSIRSFLPSWTASGPWSIRRDAIRSALEFGRAFIGYILMLAVMTFNVGVFCAILTGILAGELVLGRYSHGSGWTDGACHDG